MTRIANLQDVVDARDAHADTLACFKDTLRTRSTHAAPLITPSMQTYFQTEEEHGERLYESKVESGVEAFLASGAALCDPLVSAGSFGSDTFYFDATDAELPKARCETRLAFYAFDAIAALEQDAGSFETTDDTSTDE